MEQLLFLGAFLVVLIGSHFFIYFSFVSFFRIIGIYKIWIGSVIAVLPALFIISSIIAHYYFNYFTRTLYFISGLWLAVALNLILAFLVIWLLIGSSKIFNFNLNLKFLGWLGIFFSFLFLIYGIWNTYDTKIKNITVKIKDLPIEWQNKKAVQISDVHLGYVYGKDRLRFLVDKIKKLDPDIIFITGDLFDGMDGRLGEMVDPLNQLDPPLGAYFITGNHETYLGVDKAFASLSKTKVKILDDAFINIDGLQLIGLSFPSRGINENRNFEEIFGSLPGLDLSKPTILLYHSPMQVVQAKDLGIDLFLAGHTHVGQLFPFEFITNIVYSGFDYGLHTDGDFSIYTSSGVGTWGPTARTSKNSEIVLINFETK